MLQESKGVLFCYCWSSWHGRKALQTSGLARDGWDAAKHSSTLAHTQHPILPLDLGRSRFLLQILFLHSIIKSISLVKNHAGVFLGNLDNQIRSSQSSKITPLPLSFLISAKLI